MNVPKTLTENFLNSSYVNISMRPRVVFSLLLLLSIGFSAYISVSLNLSDYVASPGHPITVSGKAILYPDNIPVADNPISIWVDGNCLAGVSNWWNSSWLYRRPIQIHNTAGDLTDYQVKIEINLSKEFSEGKIQQYCEHVRFTYLNTTHACYNEKTWSLQTKFE